MEYKGPKTNLDIGQTFVDKYLLFTNNTLDTFKRHNNVFISLNSLNISLKMISRTEFNKRLKSVYLDNNNMLCSLSSTSLVNKCMNKLLEDLKSISGFSTITYRKFIYDDGTESNGLIFEGEK